MEEKFRCNCPCTSALDVVGDGWTLVIVKLILLEGKSTFKEFVESDEAISTNILADRLRKLEANGLLRREDHPENRKTKLYVLTQQGLDLAPVIIELILWSDQNVRPFHKSMLHTEMLVAMQRDKAAFIDQMVEQYKHVHWK